ncbi:tetratricopeptide repeat protein [Polyangium aurulentum]|uniref:tetratricopeptide repeat protein n=1 Tax=Polyangium aurulentum TaxID=2567896 RepID=UPI0010ADF0AB|nr:tetratricopeptide repeat protein [Polyangium aurulentum]UQA62942.1 tetratricopeptide repeat protein [Polyangium aurulentum]
MRKVIHRALASLVLVGSILSGAAAYGQASSADKAAADALFKDGRALLKQGKAAEACPKFEESQRYDPSSSTMFNLGECYELLGRTASAYGAFGEAERMARQASSPQKVKVAAERRKAVEARLSKLVVRVSGGDAPGYSVTLDGKPLGPGTWGSALPVDPGEHALEASAPGKRAWTQKVVVGPGPSQVEATVPVLAAVEMAPPAPVEEPGWSTQRKVGVGVGAAGIAALAVGAGLGIAAVVKNEASLGECSEADPRRCNATGYALRNGAGTFADASTVTLSVGAALAVAGVVLFVTAPSTKGERGRTSAMVAPWFSPGGMGFTLRMEQ